MSYIEDSLSDGEKVEGLFKLHWFAWMPMVGWILLGIPTLGLTWIVAIYEYLKLRYTEQGVTNKRVIVKTGLVQRRTLELLLRQVEAISVDQSLLGRVFGFGSITLTGTGGVREVFHRVGDPLELRRRIHGQVA